MSKPIELTFHLRGGQSVTVKVEEYTFTRGPDGNLTGYELTWHDPKHKLIDIKIDDISAVERRG